MAEAVVSLVMDTLGNLVKEEVIALHGVRGEIKGLETELRRMQCFLKDADAKRRKGDDERVKNWVREIRDVAYQAEDVIETFIVEIEERRRRQRSTGCMGSIKRYIALTLTELIARHKISIEIKEINAKIRDISESRERYGIVDIGRSGGDWRSSIDETERMNIYREVSPYIYDDTDAIVGFKDDRRIILERLLDPTIKRRCVISIVGMGGLGKTTLAKRVYNSSDITTHFDTCVWVDVSQKYSAIELLETILKKVPVVKIKEGLGLPEDLRGKKESGVLEDLTGKKELGSMEDLKHRLWESLRDRKYLVVMDDVWQEVVWAKIGKAFPDSKNGSRVMFTTRFMEVAKSADPDIPPHEPSCLNEAESWELLLKKAIPRNEEFSTSCPEELEGLGRQFTKKCGGLPLALVVLGGLLSVKEPMPIAWLEMAERMDWVSEGGQCMDILALSYNDLPDYHMKSCFLYCGFFPEDYEIEANQLISMWTAEGFIPPREKQTMEETAKTYLDQLVQRCLIQVVHSKYDGSVSWCRIHDLLHELCISEAREDGFLNICSMDAIGHATSSNAVSARRLALYNRTDDECVISLDAFAPKLRTLSLLHLQGGGDDIGFNRLKLLRVINLRGTFIRRLPEEIKNLIHLKYLGLMDNGLCELPSSIEYLCNLQTLDVRANNIDSVPDGLWKIPTLRHVWIDMAIPQNIGILRNLQTLQCASARGGWIEKDLKKLTNLRNLWIEELEVSQSKALCDSLGKLGHLVSLTLSGESIPVSLSNHPHLRSLFLDGVRLEQQFPDIPEFPPNLINLSLRSSELNKDQLQKLEKLRNLRVLRLWSGSYGEKRMICSAGGFPRLQCLELRYLDLDELRIEEGAMPTLKSFVIRGPIANKMLPERLSHLTTFKIKVGEYASRPPKAGLIRMRGLLLDPTDSLIHRRMNDFFF